MLSFIAMVTEFFVKLLMRAKETAKALKVKFHGSADNRDGVSCYGDSRGAP